MRGFESARPEVISPPLGAFELGHLEPRLVRTRPQIKLVPLQNIEDGFGEPEQPFIQVQGCISCGILVSGIQAHGVSLEHMENMEMFSCSPT